MSIDAIQEWMNGTALHETMQELSWAVPLVQTIHILAITVIIGANLMLNLRMVGVVGRHTPILRFGNRYVPYILPTLLVLLATGLMLVTAEPERNLSNQTFWIKMALVAFATICTLVVRHLFHRDWDTWQRDNRAHVVKIVGLAMMAAWVGIIFCGRWIAYTY